MRLATKVAYNTIVQALSKTIATALGLVAIALMARYLGKFGFGQYTTVITFLSFFAIVADLGLTLVTVQMISRPGADEKRILGNLMALRLVSAIIFLGLAPLVVLFFPYSPAVKLGVGIAAASFVFTALNQVFVGIFQKYLRMDRVSVAEVTGRLTLLAGVISVIAMDWGLYGILFFTVIANFVSFFLHYLFSKKFTRVKLYFDIDKWKEILRISWPLGLTILFNLLYLKTDTLLLSIIERPSSIGIIAEVGIYGAAYKVIDVLVSFPFVFSGIVLPILTLRWNRNDKEGFKYALQKAFNVMMIIGIPLVVGTQFVSREIMTLVAGEEFTLSGPLQRLLIFAAGFIFFGNIFAHAVIAIDRQKKIIWAYFFTAATSIIGYFIFIPRFSYIGAAYITIYSEVFIAFASLYTLWKFTRFLPKLDVVFKSILASSGMAVAIILLHNYWTENLYLTLGLAASVYFVFLYGLRGLSGQDIKDLLNK